MMSHDSNHPSLATISTVAQELWQQLDQADDPTEEERLLDQIWQTEADRKVIVDGCVQLSIQIEAELEALKAGKQCIVTSYDRAIDRLKSWQHQVNQSILRCHANNLIGAQITGNDHEIEIRQNPPRCNELTIPISEVDPQFVRIKEIRELDKKAVLDAWKQSIPVQGVTVVRDLKVVYKLTATNREQLKLKATQPRKRSQSKRSKQ